MEELKELHKEANKVLRLLFLTELTEEEEADVKKFVDDYLKVLDDDTNNKGDQHTLEKLQTYEIVINPVFGEFDDFDPSNYPAIGIIKEKVNNYYHTIEDKFAKTLTLSKNTNTTGNGFAMTLLVVGSTILLGIGLGALLWFIK